MADMPEREKGGKEWRKDEGKGEEERRIEEGREEREEYEMQGSQYKELNLELYSIGRRKSSHKLYTVQRMSCNRSLKAE